MMKTKQLAIQCVVVILFAALFFFTACREKNGNQRADAKVLDLTDRFSQAESSQSGAHFEQNLHVIRRGVRRNALVIAAPISIHASLQGVSGKLVLKGWAAPVFNIGDGMEMNLFLRRDGIRYPIISRCFDAARKAEDRDWVPIEIPLDLTGEDRLEIDVSAGPQGDLTADWLALSSLSLFRSKSL